MKRIPLTQGKFALVDDADFEWLSQWKWCVNAQGYAVRRVYIGTGQSDNRGYFVRMHREVIKAPALVRVDHINGDRLDNQKSNLRLASNAENLWNRSRQANNTSGVKGVTWSKAASKWMAMITVNGKHYYLGVFTDKADAAKAYSQAAKELHGEFACV